MAVPHPTTKPTVNLASPGPRVSRIRRDPPPPEKKLLFVDLKQREQWTVVIGVTTFAIAIFIIILGFGGYGS